MSEMKDLQRPVALALVTQTQLDMLGKSLKHVYRKGDSDKQFDELLRAFNEADNSTSNVNSSSD